MKLISLCNPLPGFHLLWAQLLVSLVFFFLSHHIVLTRARHSFLFWACFHLTWKAASGLGNQTSNGRDDRLQTFMLLRILLKQNTALLSYVLLLLLLLLTLVHGSTPLFEFGRWTKKNIAQCTITHYSTRATTSNLKVVISAERSVILHW